MAKRRQDPDASIDEGPVRSLVGLPITYPGTTGVPAPLTGGVLARRPT